MVTATAAGRPHAAVMTSEPMNFEFMMALTGITPRIPMFMTR